MDDKKKEKLFNPYETFLLGKQKLKNQRLARWKKFRTFKLLEMSPETKKLVCHLTYTLRCVNSSDENQAEKSAYREDQAKRIEMNTLGQKWRWHVEKEVKWKTPYWRSSFIMWEEQKKLRYLLQLRI